jgi:hypothetical protein
MSGRINSHSELVFNVLRYATSMLEKGDESALLLMGFEAEEVRALECLTVKHLQRLGELGTHFMDFRVDHDCFRKLVERLTGERRIEHLQDALLLAGAPLAMMHRYWGMTTQDCASRRRVLGIETPIGRPQRLSDAELEQLWHDWSDLDEVDDERERYLKLAERSGHALAAIWPVVEAWKTLPRPAKTEGMRSEAENRSSHRRERVPVTPRAASPSAT